jgi:Zn-dependent protease
VGIVVLIFVHEMGHVFVAWRQGAPISAPIFIPFMGALIVQKRMPNSAWAEAVLGIGGPLGGTVGALLCFAVYGATGSEFFLALAYFGFFINLFNLTPIHPLDGGWIVASISTYLWLAGLAALVTLFALGLIRNPFILVLLIVSIPTMWRGLTHKGEYFPGLAPATRLQKLIMGVSYVGLAGGLLWGMAVCHAAGRFR